MYAGCRCRTRPSRRERKSRFDRSFGRGYPYRIRRGIRGSRAVPVERRRLHLGRRRQERAARILRRKGRLRFRIRRRSRFLRRDLQHDGFRRPHGVDPRRTDTDGGRSSRSGAQRRFRLCDGRCQPYVRAEPRDLLRLVRRKFGRRDGQARIDFAECVGRPCHRRRGGLRGGCSRCVRGFVVRHAEFRRGRRRAADAAQRLRGIRRHGALSGRSVGGDSLGRLHLRRRFGLHAEPCRPATRAGRYAAHIGYDRCRRLQARRRLLPDRKRCCGGDSRIGHLSQSGDAGRRETRRRRPLGDRFAVEGGRGARFRRGDL